MNREDQNRHSRDRWLLLLYLCDDYEETELATPEPHRLRDINDTILEAIQSIEQTKELHTPVDVVYQFDSFLDIQLQGFQKPSDISSKDFDRPDQHCIRRYLKWQDKDQSQPHWDVVRHASYRTINTGKTETLHDFFEWARRPIRDAAGIIVVFAGLGVGDKNSIVGNIDQGSDYGRLFSVCDDKSAKDALNPIEVQAALELLVNEYRDGEPIDLLGFDMSSMQFIEVAYQFIGLARTVVASQNTDFDPFWPYADLLSKLAELIQQKQRNGNYISPISTGSLFVETIGRHLDKRLARTNEIADERPIVTAIDVGQLDLVARSLDTLFLNILQSLGDEAIWHMRDCAFQELRHLHQQSANNSRLPRSLVAYDLQQMLQILRQYLKRICSVEGVLNAWLEEQLRELHDPNAADRFFDRRAVTQKRISTKDPHFKVAQEEKEIRRVVENFISSRIGENEHANQPNKPDSPISDCRLWRLLHLLTFDENHNPYLPNLSEFERQGNTTSDLPHYPKLSKNLFSIDEADQTLFWDVARSHDDAKAFLRQLKERFERITPEQLNKSAATAWHLLGIAEDVIALVSPPAADTRSDLPGLRNHSTLGSNDQRQQCIIAQYSFNNQTEFEWNDEETTWQRCGISIYRPEHLDRLADSQYLDFSFHRRVHWVSLMAAINLIRKHSGQIWNVISSLLSTCTGKGRDDLLQRISGPSSVLNRFGNQFRALQNPLTLTLTVSLDREKASSSGPPPEFDTTPAGVHSVGSSVGNPPFLPQTDANPGHQANINALFYKLTLETNLHDAFVDTATSSMNRSRAQRATERLETIISPAKNRGRLGFDSMTAYARDLGEDIFPGIDLHKHEVGDSIPHLHLQLPIELMGLPWEVMNDGRGSLCERFAISRQALIEAGTARPSGIRASGKIRILIIGDPLLCDEVVEKYRAEQLSGAVEEAQEVARLFRALKRNLPGTVDFNESDIFIRKQITGHDVRQLLRNGKYDIVHFAGHALHNEHAPDRSSWLMSDGELHAQELANTLKHCVSCPWLVYANACESGMSSTGKPRHRTNVYGLGTAFTNNGVTAYLGPLWPIGDYVAGQMATDFYKGLLLERATIGESLFTAKRNAKQRLEGALASDLSWAGMIVYGDSRMKLLDSLGIDDTLDTTSRSNRGVSKVPTESTTTDRQRNLKRLRKFSSTGQPIQPMQASVRSTRAILDDIPLFRSAHRRRDRLLGFSENEIAVELRQVNGIRHWQYATHSREEFAGLPGSPLLDNLTSNQRFRHRIGIRGGQLLDDSSRLVGQWRIPVSSGRNFNQVLQSLDSGTVTQEGLVRVEGDLEANTMRPSELRQLCNDLRRRIGGRVLLLLHDSFGTTEQMIDSLGQEFIRRAEREYVAVLGFDHWSLQRSSIEIADQLARELSALFQTGESGMKRPANTIDIIGFGRGGLVGRMLAEQHNQSAGEQPTISELIRNVALVGTPSFNSRAVSSDQWGLMADQLANNVHQDAHGYYAKMSATYAQLAALSEFHAPASLAKKAASFLLDDVPPLKLRSPDGISYCAVAAAYAPAAEVTASRIIHEYCHSAPHEFGEKQSLFLPGDLVVSTDDVWARTRQVSDVRETDDGGLTWVKNKVYWKGIPSLLIEPTDKTYYSNMAVPEDCVPIRVPKNTRRVEQNGVHHANLLSMPHCHDFLMSHLFPQD